MSAQNNVAPIIIKKKKVSGGDGHHGGAWKVAYADFVTAMMAFFLLMWLLNATTEQQRKGIADYFSPTVPVNRISGGGDGMFAGDSIFSENTLARNGTGGLPPVLNSTGEESGIVPTQTKQQEDSQAEKFGEVEDFMLGGGGESIVMENMMKHVVTRQTDEGLVIEIFDLDGLVLFTEGTDTPNKILVDLARLMSDAFQMVGNNIALEAHVRSEPVVVAESKVWDMSAARANKIRILLESHGIASNRMVRVTGHADRELASADPLNIRNNRLEIILLRSDHTV